MADEEEDLQINVTSTADTGGIDQATESVKGLGTATGQGAHSMRELLLNARHSNEVFRGIEGAAKGGAGGIMEMAKGFRALLVLVTEGMAASGLGGLVLLLGVLGGAFLALTRHTKETGEELKKTADRAEEFKKASEEMAKAVEADFKQMDESAKELVATMERLDKMQRESEARVKALNEATTQNKEAGIDLDEQKALAAAKTPEEKADIQTRAELAKTNARLDAESNASTNTVLAARAESERDEKYAAQARQQADAADAEARQKAADAADATAHAKALGSQVLETMKTGGTVSDQVDKERKAAVDDALAKQNAAKKAADLAEGTHGELSKVTEKAADAASKLDTAKELDAVKQDTIAKERAAAVVKANTDLAAAAQKATDALSTLAADAINKGGEKGDGKEGKGEEEAEKAADNHLTESGEKALEKMSSGAEKLHAAVTKHAERTAESHEATTAVLTKTTRRAERSERREVNEASYSASP